MNILETIIIYTGFDGTHYSLWDILVGHGVAALGPMFLTATIVSHAHARLSGTEWRAYLTTGAITGLVLLYMVMGIHEFDNYQRYILKNHEWRDIAVFASLWSIGPVCFFVFRYIRRRILQKQTVSHVGTKVSHQKTLPQSYTLPIRYRQIEVPIVTRQGLLITTVLLLFLLVPGVLCYVYLLLGGDPGWLTSGGVFLFFIPPALMALPIRNRFMRVVSYEFSSDSIAVNSIDNTIRHVFFWNDISSIAWAGPAGALATMAIQGHKKTLHTVKIGSFRQSDTAMVDKKMQEMIDILESLPGTIQKEFDPITFSRDVHIWRPPRDTL